MAATVTGAHFHLGSTEHVAGGAASGAGSLSLSSIADHTTVPGSGTSGSGFDTVNAPGTSGVVSGGASSDVVATQSTDGGNVVVHLSDGSSITIVGTNHIDATFNH